MDTIRQNTHTNRTDGNRLLFVREAFQFVRLVETGHFHDEDIWLQLPESRENNCGRQEEPAILISRLLLRMRRSIRLDSH